MYKSIHFLLQKSVTHRKNASEPSRLPSVTKVWVIRLGFVLITPRTFEEGRHMFPQEHRCIRSHCTSRPHGKQLWSIFDLDPDLVKLTMHKSVKLKKNKLFWPRAESFVGPKSYYVVIYSDKMIFLMYFDVLSCILMHFNVLFG